jgi:D-alanyl-D-alanine carboxypeptidase (penicillin-binding protein 5/6)
MRFLWIFVVQALFCCFLRAKPLEVEIRSSAAILMNAASGAILFEKEPHTCFYPASVTKIATALFVLDKKKGDLGQRLTVSKESLKVKSSRSNENIPSYWLESDGTKMGLAAGEEISLEALLHGLMMISGNDAANVIAEGFADSIPSFMEEVNQYLKELGCRNTQFTNPHGLHHPAHFTTAYDICLMTKAALSIPTFREIVAKPSYVKPKTNKHEAALIRHTNPLLKEGPFYYPKAIGVKTGFHSHAKNTFVAAAEDQGRVLIGVFLGCEDRKDRYEDAIRLFDAAFAEQKEERCFFPAGHSFSREVVGTKEPLQAELLESVALSYYPAEEPSVRAFLHWDVPSLPIQKGRKVGEVRLIDAAGAILQRQNLCAKRELKGTFLFRLKKVVFLN